MNTFTNQTEVDRDRPRLEVLSAVPPAPTSRRSKVTPAAAAETEKKTPLLFVHGAYTGAWCWAEHFLNFFAKAGYESHAVSLSGHGRSRGRRSLDSFSIIDYAKDVREVAKTLHAPPVLIGHSMGGFVVQKYLERHAAPGAVLMCSVPPQGLMSSAVDLFFRKPDMMNDLGSVLGGTGASIETLRESLFAQPVDSDDLERFYRLSQSESQRAIWDMTLFNLPNPALLRGIPLLVQGAEYDHLIPKSLVDMTANAYRVAPQIFPGMGHGLMLERDWKLPAQSILDWLEATIP
jgi:non-heme chloroperoxidase